MQHLLVSDRCTSAAVYGFCLSNLNFFAGLFCLEHSNLYHETFFIRTQSHEFSTFVTKIAADEKIRSNNKMMAIDMIPVFIM